jgi:hypothetical protein
MFVYLKHYYSIKHKDVSILALNAWRDHNKGEKRTYNMDVCRRFQQAYIHTYRDNHAKAQLAKLKKQ